MHHRRYPARLAPDHDYLADLTKLCAPCHREVTRMLRARRHATHALPRVAAKRERPPPRGTRHVQPVSQPDLPPYRPLIMHNGRLGDPLGDWAPQFERIAQKRAKTEADLQEMSRIEWYGGLYSRADLGRSSPAT